MLLRRALHALGCRYRVQRRLARGCTPDIIFVRARLAVFVDGDFWHGCPRHGARQFRGENAELWQAKMERNSLQDARATELAEQLGFRVMRFWECDVRQNTEALARQLYEETRVLT